MIPSDPVAKESDDEPPLIDITGKLVDKEIEHAYKKDKEKRKK